MVRVAMGPHRHLVWLDQSRFDRVLVGGKGASLSQLAALGAPVPKACALTTLAYADFAASLSLPRQVAGIHESDLPRIRAEILSAPLPHCVAKAISSAYRKFETDSGPDLSLAVRSSATAEDSAAFSFAGLHDTLLGVRSLEALEASVRQCWASMWSDRALSYRRTSTTDSGTAEIAVVVQQLVRSDVSFVLFTTDPVTGSHDRLVISASWGLGEAVVSGLVTPDHIVVDPFGRVVEYSVGHKQHMIIAETYPAEGSRQVTVPRALRTMPVMTHEQASRIAEVGRVLSARLGYEVDVEGGIVNGVLHLFQARPITTLGDLPKITSPVLQGQATSVSAWGPA